MSNKKIKYLDSLIRVAQSDPQKEQSAKRSSSDSTLIEVELFTKEQEINALKERAKAEPVVRQERVDEIRKAIQNETYNIESGLVVRSILKSHLLDELLR